MSVIDNGAGIAKEGTKKLFKEFSRLNEHDRNNKSGTGLGLKICRNII